MARSAFLGGAALATSGGVMALAPESQAAGRPQVPYPLAEAEHVIYSVCLQCHTDCPIKGKFVNGTLTKISGSGFSSQNMLPHIEYGSSPWQAVRVDGKLCPKGQAGIQTVYDPYRLRKVLKRVGRRGESRWRIIPFTQAIDEIVKGGRLFAHVNGEENRRVPGLKELYKLRDPALAKTLKQDALNVGKGKLSLETFQAKHLAHLDVLIDSKHPDLGPVNNQFVFLAGRIEHGRKEFAKRWLKGGFGSVNWFEHTTVCEQSHHIAHNEMTRPYHDGKWGHGKHHLKPDALNAEFIVYFGTGAFEANFGPTNMAEKVTSGLADGRLKIAVVDPRLSKTAGKAWKWLPLRPGTDAAVAFGMMRWMLENDAYDAAYLSNANQAAAAASGESTWSNASWLVKLDAKGAPGALLRARDVGLGEDEFVVASGQQLVAVEPHGKAPVRGDLRSEGERDGVSFKSAFQLLWGQAAAHPVEGWAEIAGVDVDDLVAIARELGRRGKRGAVELYRGPVQHTNGYYNAQAIISLNVLLGNTDWKGGVAKGGGHWYEDGSKPGQPFPLKKGVHPGKLDVFGVTMTREKWHYEDSSLFARDGYPAKRPWYPLTGNVYQEVLPSLAQGYPYHAKAVFLHKGTPGLSLPAANEQIAILSDPEKLPLLFTDDIVVGDSSVYADYVFPDVTAWERWGTPHVSPDVLTKTSKVRQPMVAPIPEEVSVFGENVPCSMEAVMLAIAEKLELPGYGPNGFGAGVALTKPEDFYLKGVANIAAGDKPGDAVPAAADEEVELLKLARRHLPPSVFDAKRWERSAGAANWRRVVTVLNRGGRYEPFRNAYAGKRVRHQYKGQFNLYVENVALAVNSMTGERFSGLPVFEEVKDALGRAVRDEGYDFRLITYKDITGGHSRTLPTDSWLASINPENYVMLNERDGRRLALQDGDPVRIVSASNKNGIWKLGGGRTKPIVGKVRLLRGLRPGTVAVSWHFGHWAYGSAPIEVDLVKIPGDEKRARGLCANAALRVDPALGDVCLSDLIGGSTSFYDTHVRLERA